MGQAQSHYCGFGRDDVQVKTPVPIKANAASIVSQTTTPTTQSITIVNDRRDT